MRALTAAWQVEPPLSYDELVLTVVQPLVALVQGTRHDAVAIAAIHALNLLFRYQVAHAGCATLFLSSSPTILHGLFDSRPKPLRRDAVRSGTSVERGGAGRICLWRRCAIGRAAIRS